MAPAASITDVWENRPAHGALAVRLVQFTPAADAREPGRSHRAQPRARGRNARRGPSYKYRKPPPRHESARTAPGRAHAFATHLHTRRLHTRAHKVRSGEDAHKRAHTENPVEGPGPPRKLRETCARTTSARVGTASIPRRHCVGTASVPHRPRVGLASAPRACSAEYPLSASQSSLENTKDRVVPNRVHLEYPVEYPESTTGVPLSIPPVPLGYIIGTR
jgi:hypothetical protein